MLIIYICFREPALFGNTLFRYVIILYNNARLFTEIRRLSYEVFVLSRMNTFNFLVCMLALLVGILIGEKYRKWKKEREEKKNGGKGADIKRSSGPNPDQEDSDPPV